MVTPRSSQPLLPFDVPALAPEGLLEAQLLARSHRLLAAWPDWPGGALVLAGATATVRATLARHWMALVAAAGTAVRAGPVSTVLQPDEALWVEGEDHDTAGLFAVLSAAEAGRLRLLMTADRPPRAWEAEISDVRSRLLAVPVDLLPEPDFEQVAGLIQAHATRAGATVSPEIARWAATRLVPGWDAPRRLVGALQRGSGLPGAVGRADIAAALAELDRGDTAAPPDPVPDASPRP